jgi:hypothetical protein
MTESSSGSGGRGRATTWLPPLGFAAVAATLASRRLADFDLPWHLALGRVVLGTRSLPRIDPLAFTARPIQHMEFLSDALLYGLMRAGGPFALQLFGALVAVATGAVLWFRMRGDGPLATLVVALTLVATHDFFLVRPATLSFLLLAVWLWAIDVHRRRPNERRGRQALAFSVLLVPLWVNVHGFSVIAVALAIGYAGYRSACRLAAGRLGALLPRADGDRVVETWLAAFAALVASGANLAGYRLLTAPLHARADFGRITEWASTGVEFLLRHDPAAAVLLVATLAALFWGKEPDGHRLPNAFDLGLVVLGFALARSAVRLVPIGVVMVAPLVSRRLAGFVRPSVAMQWACGGALMLAAPLIGVLTPTSFGVGFEPAHFPEGAVRFIRAHKPAGRMWNFLPFGGYLSWRLWPDYRVLVDGRSGWVHDPALLARVHASESDDEAFRSLTSDLDLRWAVTRASEGERFGVPLARSADWRMVYLDDVSAVYVRLNGENAELARHGYRLLRHLTPPEKALSAALDRSVPPEVLAADGRLAREQDPASSRAAFFDACGALARRDRAAFVEARRRLAALAPGHPALGVLAQAAVAAGMPAR